MKYILKGTLVLWLFCMSITSISQNRWSVEFRPDINFPTKDFGTGDSKVDTGFGFEFTGAYRMMEHLSLYAGWSFNTFNIQESDYDLDETGYTFGLQWIHPLGTSSSLSYLLRGGATYNHIEIENTQGNVISDSGHGFGYQLEAGINYALGNHWVLRPTIRYRTLSRDLEIEGTTATVHLNYLSFGLGIAKTF